MRRVFKPENVFQKQRTIIIPDIEFKEEQSPAVDENGEPIVLTDDLYKKIRSEIVEETTADIRRKKINAARERDTIISNAKKEAEKIRDEAAVDRQKILNEANAAAEAIKIDAYKEGLKKGIDEKSEVLENLANQINSSIEQIREDQNEYFEEYEKQIKYLASDIAEKIIYQRIDDDDMAMYNLTKNAIKTVRDAAWIKAEVSEKLYGYIDSLEKELAGSGINAEIIINDSAPSDTCVLNTSDSLIVASVSQQIANLKEYITRQDMGGNDE